MEEEQEKEEEEEDKEVEEEEDEEVEEEEDKEVEEDGREYRSTKKRTRRRRGRKIKSNPPPKKEECEETNEDIKKTRPIPALSLARVFEKALRSYGRMDGQTDGQTLL